MQAGEFDAVRDWQHGDAYLGVVVAAGDGQGPEMRRRPGEDDEEQQHRLGSDLAGHRGPAEHRRHRPGGTADDDVLRGGGFQQHGIDHRIADERGRRQSHGEGIHEVVEQPQARPAERAGEYQRLACAQLAARQRAPARALHHRIDALLHQAVHRRGCTGDQGDAERGSEQQAGRHHAGRGQEHADDRRKDNQRDDARLGERIERLQPVLKTDAKGLGIHVRCVRWT